MRKKSKKQSTKKKSVLLVIVINKRVYKCVHEWIVDRLEIWNSMLKETIGLVHEVIGVIDNLK